MSDLVKSNRANFSKKAALYDKYAIFQKDVADILINQLKVGLLNANLKDSLVLDLGSGTGFSSSKLKDITSAKKIIHLDHSYEMLNLARKDFNYICADMHNLPFTIHQNKDKFDVIYSNLAMQWCTDIPNLLKDLKNILKQNGSLAFSTVLDGSLFNMKMAYGKLDKNPPVQDFLSYEYLIDLIKSSGFNCIFCENKKMTYNFPTVLSLLNSLKKVGASYIGNSLNNGFITRNFFERLSNYWPKDEAGNFILDYTVGLFVLINI